MTSGGSALRPALPEGRSSASLAVEFAKDDVKRAPRVAKHFTLTATERGALYQHYGLSAPDRR